jgi:hypothetical protein
MNQSMVRWGDIVAECGNYRDGFVAVFRQYEGQATDERDGSNRVVKVTVTSFAEHVGVDRHAFARWVRDGVRAPLPPSYQEKKMTERARSAVRNSPDAVVDAIMSAPAATQDEIFHELKLRRAGVDTSTAARKASHARAHEAVAPFRSAIAAGHVALCVAALRDALDNLNEATEGGALDGEAVAEITAAFEAFSFALAQARFAVSP